VRPTIRFLTDELIREIVSEATHILCTLGIEIHNKTVLTMLSAYGCRINMEKNHAVLTHDIIDKALKTAPESFGLYDVAG
jgi:trimethylamine:corrinoid methyltransferase-like protein